MMQEMCRQSLFRALSEVALEHVEMLGNASSFDIHSQSHRAGNHHSWRNRLRCKSNGTGVQFTSHQETK